MTRHWSSKALVVLTLHCGCGADERAPDENTAANGGASSPGGPGAASPDPMTPPDVPNAPPDSSNGSEELPTDFDPSGAPGGSGSGPAANPGPSVPPPASSSSGCPNGTLTAGNAELTLTHDGVEREYLVHVPPAYDGSAPVPLVVDMHGLTSSAAQQASLGWRQKSDEEGFIVVHPQGLNASWNAGELCCGSSQQNGVDDEGFIRALVEQMKNAACIDSSRVYATGLSNGGAMAHLLACNASDVFAAAAPVSMSNGVIPCEPSRPISVIMTRGTRDPLVPFEGGFLFASAEEDFENWAAINGCTGDAEPGAELCRTFGECDGGVEVTLCTLDAGHVPYANAQGFDIPDTVWSTFERHALP